MKERVALSAILTLLGLLVVQMTGSAVAQQPSQAQANAIRQSCRSDYQSYCSSVPTGGMASLQCLQGHISELSAPCQAAVGSASGSSPRPPSSIGQNAPPNYAPPAYAPPNSAPANGPPPPPMSPREKMAIMRRSCGGDFRAYCRGVPLGGGAAMRCLADNQSRLSPACRDVMAEARGPR